MIEQTLSLGRLCGQGLRVTAQMDTEILGVAHEECLQKKRGIRVKDVVSFNLCPRNLHLLKNAFHVYISPFLCN